MLNISFDNATGSSQDSTTSLTFSHTCSGARRLLWVGVFAYSTNDVVSSVTYAGVAMTKRASRVESTRGYVYLYSLENPATGANNVVVTSSSSVNLKAAAASYTSTSQTGVPDATAGKTVSNSQSASISVTTVAKNCWVVGYFANASPIVAGSGTTKRDSVAGANIMDSNGPVATPGPYTLNASGPDQYWSVVAASFAPGVAAGGYIL